ncbi:glycoside hydrolase family 43 protein [Streptomyces himalayensis]|uniref:Glycoside hydrolase family 43 protein n=1 Tax=Streptomyces himalayensis subsp. himalayensis TaxID=2756131 RepID=A0A7W0DRW2_9ACTN|nr:glycoside hydrolase family 43 protein [Streptomyces himalayensis]MBA2950125.1 glycoside hydrolase family 43 protein [Streptomyces himalayensis subsp. himalayensis]
MHQPKPVYVGYLLVYFVGNPSVDDERIRMALSHGNDPLHYRELNDGEPILTSSLGTRGVRDPFVIRSPDGDRFHLIATDLRTSGDAEDQVQLTWDRAERAGSKSIVVWDSSDLVNWTGQRLVKVSPDTAGNTWAPKACYADELGTYVVFWASKLYAQDDPDHTGTSYQRMLYATTTDFRTFSEPTLWHDPGHAVIDSAVIKHNGVYYRYTKDERDQTPSAPSGKLIIAEKSRELTSTTYDFVADRIGEGAVSRGEGPAVFKSNTEEKWYMFIDEFGGRNYVPFETTDLDSGKWIPSTSYRLPPEAKHGSVLPLTQAEYDRLLSAYGGQESDS